MNQKINKIQCNINKLDKEKQQLEKMNDALKKQNIKMLKSNAFKGENHKVVYVKPKWKKRYDAIIKEIQFFLWKIGLYR